MSNWKIADVLSHILAKKYWKYPQYASNFSFVVVNHGDQSCCGGIWKCESSLWCSIDPDCHDGWNVRRPAECVSGLIPPAKWRETARRGFLLKINVACYLHVLDQRALISSAVFLISNRWTSATATFRIISNTDGNALALNDNLKTEIHGNTDARSHNMHNCFPSMQRCMSMNTGNGSNMLTEPLWCTVIPEWCLTEATRVCAHQILSVMNGSDMSTTTCTIYCWDAGHSRMSLAMFAKSTREGGSFRTMMRGMGANTIVATWKLGCCLTFYIPVWASSWGTKLYVFFRNVFKIFSCKSYLQKKETTTTVLRL